MHIGIHVKYPLFLSGSNQSWTYPDRFFEKPTNTKFHENPSSWSRVAPCGQTDRQIWRNEQSLFTILETRLKTMSFVNSPPPTRSKYPTICRRILMCPARDTNLGIVQHCSNLQDHRELQIYGEMITELVRPGISPPAEHMGVSSLLLFA